MQEVAGESLIVVRDQKGSIGCFYNVCRHRGTRLCEDAAGHSSAIQCPYHAWTYALDGRLIGAPHMDGVPGFDKAELFAARGEPGAVGRVHLRQSGGSAESAGGSLRAA